MKCKAVLKDRSSDGRFNIKIRITSNRKVMYLKTQYYALPVDFDKKSGKLKSVKLKGKNDETGQSMQKKHDNINAEISKIIAGYEGKYASLSNKDSINDIHSLVNLMQSKTGDEADFYEYVEAFEKKLRNKGSVNYADSLLYTTSVLKEFTKREKLLFTEINYVFLKKFEDHLLANHKKVNTIGVYMRNIRLIFNNAINEDIIDLNMYPFRKYKIKKEKTLKRNISIKDIVTLRNIELTDNLEIIARDIFLISFYLIGINIVDLIKLDKVNGDRIIFKRSKTKRAYSIKVHNEAKKIIGKYVNENGALIFKNLYTDYRNFTKMLNKKLKNVAETAKIPVPLSTYYARHSWATIASELNISKDIIRHALGHGIDTVTDVYVDFDMKKVDRKSVV